jgi:hydrogenase expression/formation protein HypC
MCLGIPMQITKINGLLAECEARGITRQANIFLLEYEELKPGDFIMIHNGNAMQKMTSDEAQQAWETYDEILVLEKTAHLHEKLR